MKYFWSLFLSLLFGGGAVFAETLVIYSQPHTINRIIKSMEGEPDDSYYSPPPQNGPELLWFTRFSSEVIGSEDKRPRPIEHLCHSHLEFNRPKFNAAARNASLGGMTNQDLKLFSLTQGMNTVQLPTGFGIPVLSNETLLAHSMLINSKPVTQPFQLTAKATAVFQRDKELSTSPKALFMRPLLLMVPAKSTFTHEQCNAEVGMDMSPAGGMLPMHSGMVDNAGKAEGTGKTDRAGMADGVKGAMVSDTFRWKGPNGEDLIYHWMVPPGRHIYRHKFPGTTMTPFDTTLHYINIHIHPYGQYVELRDVTQNKSIFKGYAKNSVNPIGISSIQVFSSKSGVPVYSSHEYEMVTEYNNTTTGEIDAMALFYVYMHDKNFDRSRLKQMLVQKPTPAQ